MGKTTTERESDRRVMALFRGRCVVCMKPATEVHEIVTRARSKQAITLPKNRVPLCQADHQRAHFDGYTGTKAEFLRNKAIERLIMFGESLEDW